jgi:hypothetical protein
MTTYVQFAYSTMVLFLLDSASMWMDQLIWIHMTSISLWNMRSHFLEIDQSFDIVVHHDLVELKMREVFPLCGWINLFGST